MAWAFEHGMGALGSGATFHWQSDPCGLPFPRSLSRVSCTVCMCIYQIML